MKHLYLIKENGEVTEIPASEYGKLEYSCPNWKFMKEQLKVDMLEHVSVLWQGKRAHMFVDENGLLLGVYQVNQKASRIYWNATLSRGLKTKDYVYTNLNDSPLLPNTVIAISVISDYSPIVGPALLWTGDME